MLKIHERTNEQGELTGVYLRLAESGGSALELVDDDGVLPLPRVALAKVMARYGAPFDPEARIVVVAELELGDGWRVRHVRHLAGYDVVMRDYLVVDMGEGEPLCAHGASVAGPLSHLARALAAT